MKLMIKETFRVLYSPLKAFEEIAKAPSIKGPLLILLITLLASASLQYSGSARTLLQTASKSDVYVPLTETEIFTSQLMSTLMDAVFRFSVNWLIYGVMFMLVLKLFRAKEGPWHHLLIAIGYTLIVATVFVFINAIIISTFPAVHLDFEVWNGALEGDKEMLNRITLEYEETWGPLLGYQLRPYFSIVIETWTAALGAVAIHFLREVSWNKALVISAIVSVASLFFRLPLIF